MTAPCASGRWSTDGSFCVWRAILIECAAWRWRRTAVPPCPVAAIRRCVRGPWRRAGKVRVSANSASWVISVGYSRGWQPGFFCGAGRLDSHLEPTDRPGDRRRPVRRLRVLFRRGDPSGQGQGPTATTVAFSPDGRKALIASNDRTLRLHDLETHKDVSEFRGHTAAVMCVVFSADGRRALVGRHGSDASAVGRGDGRGGATLRGPHGRGDGRGVVGGRAFCPVGRGGSDGAVVADARVIPSDPRPPPGGGGVVSSLLLRRWQGIFFR